MQVLCQKLAENYPGDACPLRKIQVSLCTDTRHNVFDCGHLMRSVPVAAHPGETKKAIGEDFLFIPS